MRLSLNESGLVIFQLPDNSPLAVFLTIVAVGGNIMLILWFLVQFVRAKIRESREEKRLKREREALEAGVAGAEGNRARRRPSLMLGMGAPDKMQWIKARIMSEEKRQARTRRRTVDSADPTSQSRPNPLEGSAVVNIEMPTIESTGREGGEEGGGEVKTTDARLNVNNQVPIFNIHRVGNVIETNGEERE